MSRISFNLNGNNVEAESGQTILEAAQQYGVNIPTLCHDPRLKPTAACRLCLVEVEKAKGPVPACNTAVTQGMVVKTQSDSITESRRIALELLLSDHYGDCKSPCNVACPAGIDIQGQIAHIANGDYLEALKLIKESNPLPLVCGRVCPRFCEKQCRRNLVDGPVAINMLKRFVADMDLGFGGPYIPQKKPVTGHRVAVIGGGPAGLSAAYYLALEGHSVSLFDSNQKLGGMLRYGIPEYRLPKSILDKEITSVTRLCREIKNNVSLGKDFSIESLRSSGFEAIFLALGAQSDQKMKIPGEESPGVYSGIGFLRDVTLGKKVDLGDKIVVVGGGNTAIDAARTAVRLGAREVTVVYRRSRQEMPANAEEIDGAEEEGVEFQFLSNPVKLNAKDGRVSSIESIRMVLGAPDTSGRRRPEPLPGSEFNIEVSAVIMAIGQTIDARGLGQNSMIKLGAHGEVTINEETMETSVNGIFSGGDCTSGPATAVEAIGAGRRAAKYIDQYLRNGRVQPVEKQYNSSKGNLEKIDKKEYLTIEKVERAVMPVLKADKRRQNFAEIELGITEEMARKEAGRCLSCGCLDVFECKLRELATEYKVNDKVYAGKKRHLAIKENEHPYILRDQNKCILCGRCVRICAEVEGASALGFTRRGIQTTIEPSLGMPLCETSCDSCGQCVSTCPTGAIVSRIPLSKPGPFLSEKVPTVCPYCGIGCNIDLNVKNNRIIEVTSKVGSAVNNGNLCHRGAFEINAIQNVERLLEPMVKPNGHMVQTDWDQAIDVAGKALSAIRKKAGSKSIAVLTSPLLTNEENYLAQKMARLALGTNNIGSFSASVLNWNSSSERDNPDCSFNDIAASDFIMAYNCDLSRDYPILAIKVREAVSRGTRLAILNSRQTGLDVVSRVTLKVNRRTGGELLQAMLYYILSYGTVDRKFIQTRTKGFEKFAERISKLNGDLILNIPWVNPSRIIDVTHMLIRAKRPVIVVDANSITSAEMDFLTDLALVTGNLGSKGAGIIKLFTPGNVRGLLDMETLTAARQRLSKAWGAKMPVKRGLKAIEILSGIEKGNIQGLVVIGKEALGDIGNGIFGVPIFSVLIDTVLPSSPPYPHVILPGSTFAETSGTYTNCEGRVQKLHQALKPPSGKTNWEIIAALSTASGYPMDYHSPEEISEEITRVFPNYGSLWESKENEVRNSNGDLEKEKADQSARFRVPELKAFNIDKILDLII